MKNTVIIIIGKARSGKTYLINQIVEKYKLKNTINISFEESLSIDSEKEETIIVEDFHIGVFRDILNNIKKYIYDIKKYYNKTIIITSQYERNIPLSVKDSINYMVYLQKNYKLLIIRIADGQMFSGKFENFEMFIFEKILTKPVLNPNANEFIPKSISTTREYNINSDKDAKLLLEIYNLKNIISNEKDSIPASTYMNLILQIEKIYKLLN